MEKLGIIGGLGPAATARLMTRVVEFTDAQRDQDHLDVTVLCRPQIPDRTAYLLGVPGARSFVEPMRQAACELEAAGCTVLATPCNTSHARLEDIAAPLTRARFVPMPDASARLLARGGARRVGVLATDGTMQTGVYARALAAEGLELAPLSPDEQRAVMEVIYDRVKRGDVPGPESLTPLVEALAERCCDGVVLGCTELSVLGMPPCVAGVPVVDALDVLAASCVVACGASLRRSEVARSFSPELARLCERGAKREQRIVLCAALPAFT
ncbi:aspartate/glutamate racemase family protein [Adlercreutzia sp. ZJ242]|uniref:aspartate/glutamate racemase family protein n=1 Tax=Adlercreutzia sp. ZJ242 TaxID=2709409 RepID=UPI0013EC6FCF|nr:amino acid racemase [Adlercreutzia sp. ZJ242]